MYHHRTYIEKSDDFDKMALLVGELNARRMCDWSLGRLYAWRHSRWSKESQDDSLFEKQAELFFDDADTLCGIAITEDFGGSYYLLAQRNGELMTNMVGFLLKGGLKQPVVIIAPMNDPCQKEALEQSGFVCSDDADVTYTYHAADLGLPDIVIPHGFLLTSQKEYRNADQAELFRFYAFNPDGIYDETIDYAYKYARQNPILEPELSILLLNENGEPVSGCIGYWDKGNQQMEIEVVATRREYENRGFAKAVISECIRRGRSNGVQTFSISAWGEKTRRIYSSFGKAQAVQKMVYRKG